MADETIRISYGPRVAASRVGPRIAATPEKTRPGFPACWNRGSPPGAAPASHDHHTIFRGVCLASQRIHVEQRGSGGPKTGRTLPDALENGVSHLCQRLPVMATGRRPRIDCGNLTVHTRIVRQRGNRFSITEGVANLCGR